MPLQQPMGLGQGITALCKVLLANMLLRAVIETERSRELRAGPRILAKWFNRSRSSKSHGSTYLGHANTSTNLEMMYLGFNVLKNYWKP